jgi:peptide/nickel transport system permease protein
MRHNRLALAFGALLALIVLSVLAAPLWAEHVAGTGPNRTHTLDEIEVGGKPREVVDVEGRPIGPVWLGADGKFFLGADGRLGRDEMVRLMYGGRASLLIGFAATLLTTVLATVLALLAGYYRGWVDGLISRLLDVIWAFPVLLLGIALGIVLALGGLKIGPLEIPSGSIWITILIIGGVLVPYMARPLRGMVLSLREKEFVEAAVAQGAGPLRVMFGELLPNLSSTIIVFFTLGIANAMLFEAALSFLGVGVQPPDASWGSMVGEGFQLIGSSPLLTILPGAMIFLTVLAVNVFGDGLRDALDPHSKARLETHAGIPEPEGTTV